MVREPVAEGFYPGNARILKLMLEKLFKDTEKTIDREVIGLVAPHAGYLYSGKTAAKAYAQIEKEYDAVILLGPDHTGMAETVSISTEPWITPLGEIDIDATLAKKIISKSDIIIEDNAAHMYEHSIEVQLPFLQHRLKNLKIVPIIIPTDNTDLDTLQKIADTISKATEGKKVLFIASSDLTHFGKGYNFVPVEKDELEWIKNTDQDIIQKITELDEIQTLNNARETTVCGSVPIAILIMIMKNKKIEKGTLIDYTTSYEVSKNKDAIVGYGGIVF
ncbi:MAG: AmmeMemoRadiSam system protein B [Candidatus Aenigmarchaeota archaeon]|nr:AmmeMemoRadiSam system protein B [Candidatus Aenigmarchaeota archaeon]